MRQLSETSKRPLTRNRSARTVTGRMVTGTLFAVTSIAVGVSSSIIFAADDSAVNQAALSSGLQRAVRVAPPPPPPPTIPPTPSLPAEIQTILNISNAERAKVGVAPLAYHDQLAESAAIHAADQRNKPCASGSLTHTGSDGSNPGQRIARTGLKVSNWAENIACGYPTPEAVMSGWMGSSGHRANLLNPALTHIGVSLMYSDSGFPYWVQAFGVPS